MKKIYKNKWTKYVSTLLRSVLNSWECMQIQSQSYAITPQSLVIQEAYEWEDMETQSRGRDIRALTEKDLEAE